MTNSEKEKIDTLNILNDFLNLSFTATVQELCDWSINLIKDNYDFEITTISIFNNNSQLQLYAHFGLTNPKQSLLKTEFYRKLFLEGKQKSFNNKKIEEEIVEGFPWAKKNVTNIIQPIIYQNQVLGFLTVGYKDKKRIGEKKQKIIAIIALILGSKIGSIIQSQSFTEKIDALTDITRKMRHDFANDIQSLSLSLELFSSTDLTEEQQKYFRIMETAKKSAIEKITELKKIKQKYEQEKSFKIGFQLE